jgi:hypothetical protein
MPDIILKVDTNVVVPVNIAPIVSDTDFKTRQSLAYNAAGLDLRWNFVTTAGVCTSVAVTPTFGPANYDWADLGDGMHTCELPSSGGAGPNNDTEGYGWFTGVATGCAPWRGPIVQFSPANVVDSLVAGSDLLDVNAQQHGGTNQTGRDIGASVLLSSGTGTGQVNIASGRVNADIVYVNGAGVNTAAAQLGVNVVQAGGTAWGSGAITAGAIAADAITAAKIATGAIDADALATDAVNEITAAIKALVIESEGSITVGQALSAILSACAGVTASGGTVLKSPNGVATRITATVDGSNNRTAMTLTPST